MHHLNNFAHQQAKGAHTIDHASNSPSKRHNTYEEQASLHFHQFIDTNSSIVFEGRGRKMANSPMRILTEQRTNSGHLLNLEQSREQESRVESSPQGHASSQEFFQRVIGGKKDQAREFNLEQSAKFFSKSSFGGPLMAYGEKPQSHKKSNRGQTRSSRSNYTSGTSKLSRERCLQEQLQQHNEQAAEIAAQAMMVQAQLLKMKNDSERPSILYLSYPRKEKTQSRKSLKSSSSSHQKLMANFMLPTANSKQRLTDKPSTKEKYLEILGLSKGKKKEVHQKSRESSRSQSRSRDQVKLDSSQTPKCSQKRLKGKSSQAKLRPASRAVNKPEIMKAGNGKETEAPVQPPKILKDCNGRPKSAGKPGPKSQKQALKQRLAQQPKKSSQSIVQQRVTQMQSKYNESFSRNAGDKQEARRSVMNPKKVDDHFFNVEIRQPLNVSRKSSAKGWNANFKREEGDVGRELEQKNKRKELGNQYLTTFGRASSAKGSSAMSPNPDSQKQSEGKPLPRVSYNSTSTKQSSLVTPFAITQSFDKRELRTKSRDPLNQSQVAESTRPGSKLDQSRLNQSVASAKPAPRRSQLCPETTYTPPVIVRPKQELKKQLMEKRLRFLHQHLGAVMKGYKTRRIYHNNKTIRRYRIEFRELIQFAYNLKEEIEETEKQPNGRAKGEQIKNLLLTSLKDLIQKKHLFQSHFHRLLSGETLPHNVSLHLTSQSSFKYPPQLEWLAESQPRQVKNLTHEDFHIAASIIPKILGAESQSVAKVPSNKTLTSSASRIQVANSSIQQTESPVRRSAVESKKQKLSPQKVSPAKESPTRLVSQQHKKKEDKKVEASSPYRNRDSAGRPGCDYSAIQSCLLDPEERKRKVQQSIKKMQNLTKYEPDRSPRAMTFGNNTQLNSRQQSNADGFEAYVQEALQRPLPRESKEKDSTPSGQSPKLSLLGSPVRNFKLENEPSLPTEAAPGTPAVEQHTEERPITTTEKAKETTPSAKQGMARRDFLRKGSGVRQKYDPSKSIQRAKDTKKKVRQEEVSPKQSEAGHNVRAFQMSVAEERSASASVSKASRVSASAYSQPRVPQKQFEARRKSSPHQGAQPQGPSFVSKIPRLSCSLERHRVSTASKHEERILHERESDARSLPRDQQMLNRQAMTNAVKLPKSTKQGLKGISAEKIQEMNEKIKQSNIGYIQERIKKTIEEKNRNSPIKESPLRMSPLKMVSQSSYAANANLPSFSPARECTNDGGLSFHVQQVASYDASEVPSKIQSKRCSASSPFKPLAAIAENDSAMKKSTHFKDPSPSKVSDAQTINSQYLQDFLSRFSPIKNQTFTNNYIHRKQIQGSNPESSGLKQETETSPQPRKLQVQQELSDTSPIQNLEESPYGLRQTKKSNNYATFVINPCTISNVEMFDQQCGSSLTQTQNSSQTMTQIKAIRIGNQSDLIDNANSRNDEDLNSLQFNNLTYKSGAIIEKEIQSTSTFRLCPEKIENQSSELSSVVRPRSPNKSPKKKSPKKQSPDKENEGQPSFVEGKKLVIVPTFIEKSEGRDQRRRSRVDRKQRTKKPQQILNPFQAMDQNVNSRPFPSLLHTPTQHPPKQKTESVSPMGTDFMKQSASKHQVSPHIAAFDRLGYTKRSRMSASKSPLKPVLDQKRSDSKLGSRPADQPSQVKDTLIQIQGLLQNLNSVSIPPEQQLQLQQIMQGLQTQHI